MYRIFRKVPSNKILNQTFYKTVCSSILRLFSLSLPSFNNIKSEIIQQKIKLADDLEINYAKVGHGSHVVLCLPGVFGTIETDFEPIMKKLDHEKFTIICCDHLGYGKSRPPKRHYGKHPNLNDAKNAALLMKTLEIPKYSILGWSNGGTTGAYVVTANPTVVDKLIVWASPAFINEDSIRLTDMTSNPKNWRPERWEMMMEIYGENEMRRMLREFREYIVESNRFGGVRLDILLQFIKIPTLILHGKLDMICGIEHAQVFHQSINNSILEVWPDGQHDLHLEFQYRFIKRVETFLLTDK